VEIRSRLPEVIIGEVD
jgi:hypothetical protein